MPTKHRTPTDGLFNASEAKGSPPACACPPRSKKPTAASTCTLQEARSRILELAGIIPMGGEIRIKGSDPISGYNLAGHLIKILDALGAGEDIYPLLCDEEPGS